MVWFFGKKDKNKPLDNNDNNNKNDLNLASSFDNIDSDALNPNKKSNKPR
jgi:hypothetical protein